MSLHESIVLGFKWRRDDGAAGVFVHDDGGVDAWRPGVQGRQRRRQSRLHVVGAAGGWNAEGPSVGHSAFHIAEALREAQTNGRRSRLLISSDFSWTRDLIKSIFDLKFGIDFELNQILLVISVFIEENIVRMMENSINYSE